MRRVGAWMAGTALILVSLGTAVVTAGPASARFIDFTDSTMKPVKSLWGGATGLDAPAGVAFDDSGLMYVANMEDRSVTAYAADWAGGNTTPVKTLQGSSTLLVMPVAIAFDDDQNMYVANSDSITVYGPNWKDGDNAPIKILRGAGTEMMHPHAIAFDSIGQMYVASSFETMGFVRGSVTVYPADWQRIDTPPVARLVGNDTGLVRPTGLTFDPEGNMYVVNAYGVSVFAPGWDDPDTAPLKVLGGPGSGMDGPRTVALDDEGYMYVANASRGFVGRPHVAIYEPDWSGGQTPPVGAIYGIYSLLTDPYGIALDDAGRIYVTNQTDNSVTVYQTQTISFEPTSSVPWTTRDVTITATATSGLPVTITSTSPDVCSGSGTSPLTVKIHKLGTCTFDADQPGETGWITAPTVSDSFQVTAASQTITITQPADTPLSQKWVRVRATTTSRLPVVWTSSTPDVCGHRQGFGQRVTLVSAGTCELTATQRDNRLWDYASQSVSFNVTQ